MSDVEVVIHYRRRGSTAACNQPRWVPAEEMTDDPGKVTCGSCKRTLAWRKAGERKLLAELAALYAGEHGTVAVRDNRDGTMDFTGDDGHFYVVSATRKYPEVRDGG